MDDSSLLAFVVIGLLLTGAVLVPAYLDYRKTEQLRAAGKRVRGVVVRNSYHFGRPAGWRPVVRFTTQQGRQVEAEYARGQPFGTVRLAAGATVGIAYNESNPYDFIIL